MVRKDLGIKNSDTKWRTKRAIMGYCRLRVPDAISFSVKRGQSKADKDRMYIRALSYLMAEYSMASAQARIALQGCGLEEPLPERWWTQSPFLLSLAKAFVAGNARSLKNTNLDSLETVFPSNNQVERSRWDPSVVVPNEVV